MALEIANLGGHVARAVAVATLWLASASIVTTTTPASAATGEIVVTVNGESITAAEIDQRLKFDQLSKHKELSRQEVVDELIDENRKLQAARQSRIAVTDDDVDTAYANLAK
jgi:peptidyl-prolyl cis-trans isomerase SurA